MDLKPAFQLLFLNLFLWKDCFILRNVNEVKDGITELQK